MKLTKEICSKINEILPVNFYLDTDEDERFNLYHEETLMGLVPDTATLFKLFYLLGFNESKQNCTELLNQFKTELEVSKKAIEDKINNKKNDKDSFEEFMSHYKQHSSRYWLDRKEKQTYVYFMLAGKYIKIGFSNNIHSRMSTLQTGNPSKIQLLCAINGRREEELMLHKKFKDYHYKGEWFHYVAPIKEYIENIKSKTLLLGEIK